MRCKNNKKGHENHFCDTCQHYREPLQEGSPCRECWHGFGAEGCRWEAAKSCCSPREMANKKAHISMETILRSNARFAGALTQLVLPLMKKSPTKNSKMKILCEFLVMIGLAFLLGLLVAPLITPTIGRAIDYELDRAEARAAQIMARKEYCAGRCALQYHGGVMKWEK